MMRSSKNLERKIEGLKCEVRDTEKRLVLLEMRPKMFN